MWHNVSQQADLHGVDSPKIRTNEFVVFLTLRVKTKTKITNLFVCFLGESMKHQSAYDII